MIWKFWVDSPTLNIKFIGRDMREKIKKGNSSGIWFKVVNRNLTVRNKKST